MDFKKYFKDDFITVYVCAITLAIGYYALQTDFSLFDIGSDDQKSSATTIGEVSLVESDVRLRGTKNIFWKNARKSDSIGQGDSLFVGPESSITVKFEDGKSLTIGANSLIKFKTENEKVKLSLQYGSVKSENLPAQLVLDDCGKSLNIESTDSSAGVEIGKSSGCGKVQVKASKGEVKVNKKTVAKNQKFVSKPKPVTALVEKPKVNLVVARLESLKTEELKKINQLNAQDLQEKIEVVKTTLIEQQAQQDLKKSDLTEEILPSESVSSISSLDPLTALIESLPAEPEAKPSTEAAVDSIKEPSNENNLSSDQIVSIDKPEIASESASIQETIAKSDLSTKPAALPETKTVTETLTETKLPQKELTKPLKIETGKTNQATTEWINSLNQKNITVEASSTPDFAQPMVVRSPASLAEVQKVSGNEIFYRLKSPENPEKVIDTGKIDVVYPKIKPVQNKLVYDYVAKNPKDKPKEKDFKIKWNEIPNAEKYVVEVSKNSKFTDAEKIVVRKPSSVIKVPEQGNYKFRVSAYNAGDRKISSMSKAGEIIYNRIFDLNTPSIEKTAAQLTYFFQKGAGRYIWLKWNGNIKDTHKYRIELSKDESFSKIIKTYSTRKNRVLIQENIPEGQYFWRVRSESGTNAEQVSDWSRLGYIEINSGAL